MLDTLPHLHLGLSIIFQIQTAICQMIADKLKKHFDDLQ